MHTQNNTSEGRLSDTHPSRWQGRVSTTVKMVGVGAMVLILWAASAIVGNIVDERSDRQQEVHREIASKWGEPQLIGGPIITIPYRRNSPQGPIISRGVLHLLPETLESTANIAPTEKKRGIFSSTVYSASIATKGTFNTKLIDDFKLDGLTTLHWDKATVSVSISDTRGIGNAATINWGGNDIPFKSGSLVDVGSPQVGGHGFQPSHTYRKLAMHDAPIASFEDTSAGGFHDRGQYEPSTSSGLQANVSLKRGYEYDFDYDLNIQGSRLMEFVPLGRETGVSIEAPWASPSFVGSFLPNESTLEENSFNASWKVSSLGRSYPDVWLDNSVSTNLLQSSAFGVNLLQTVDFYTLTDRTIKYAILFIALTFLAFFLFEVIAKLRIHPLQYLLIGIALVLFYLLLLSFAENIGFMWAYIIATIMTVGLVWTYSKSVLHTGRRSFLIAFLLLALYIYLYVVLQLEQLALLFGSLLLFIVLAIVMRVTKGIDWYKGQEG